MGIDEEVAEIRKHIEKAEEAFSSGDNTAGISHAEEAIERIETLHATTGKKNKARHLRDEARQVHKKARDMKGRRGQIASEIERLDDNLDRTKDTAEESPELALDNIKDIQNKLDSIESDASGFKDLQGRVNELREDCKTVRQKAEDEQRYNELLSRFNELEDNLDKAENKVEEDPQSALDVLSSISESLYSIEEEADEFETIQGRVEELETRHDEIKEKAESELDRKPRGGRSEVRGTPTSRTSGSSGDASEAPDLSIGYDGISDKEPIGSGGNADVYQATYDGKIIAVKEPRMSGTLHKETAERMMREAETWDSLDDHDHIVGLIDYDSEPLPWIAMEYMDAGDISEVAGNMKFDRALWISIVTTEAVRHAHRRGVAHLDLKPENVLFSTSQDGKIPKVADWGLSKHLLNHSKSVEGLSPQYSAPEQFDDSYGATDDITDIYQLGAVFYEMFTGEPPFEGNPARIMNQVMNEEPTPPSEVADVPSELDDILLTAMATEKKERYESVLYLRDSLQTLYDEK
jgi:tRNA A-37 threonylcarbamoyl transferase component Bud32